MSTEKEIPVEQALERGRKMLTLPASIGSKVLIGIMVLLACLKIVPWQITLLSIPLSLFLFPWIYKSYRATKWKLWAYEHTRNVHELKTKALMEGIISEHTGFLEEFFRTQEEKRKMLELQRKFQVWDHFTDKPKIPAETIFYYPKRIYTGAFLLFTLGGLLSVFAFLMTHNLWNLLLLVAAIFFAIQNFRKRREQVPYITLNDQGIRTYDHPFTSWADISNETVRSGKGEDSDSFYLLFNNIHGEESVCIDKLEVKPVELYDLLKVYRGRFEEKTKKNL